MTVNTGALSTWRDTSPGYVRSEKLPRGSDLGAEVFKLSSTGPKVRAIKVS